MGRRFGQQKMVGSEAALVRYSFHPRNANEFQFPAKYQTSVCSPSSRSWQNKASFKSKEKMSLTDSFWSGHPFLVCSLPSHDCKNDSLHPWINTTELFQHLQPDKKTRGAVFNEADGCAWESQEQMSLLEVRGSDGPDRKINFRATVR